MRMQLWLKILIALVLGVIAGLLLGKTASDQSVFLGKLIWAVGTIFLNLIKMVIVPLVFASLVAGAASISDIRKLGRIGGKTIVYFLATTAFAIIIGLILGNIIKPGLGLTVEAPAGATTTAQTANWLDTIVAIFPTNPIDAMVKAQMLPIIVFALFVGASISLAGKVAEPVGVFFNSFAEVMYKMITGIMTFAPFGVFALIAAVVGKYGPDVLLPFAKLIITVYIGCILHMLLVYAPTVVASAKMSPVKFFKEAAPAMILAFSTASSSATLPVSMKVTEEGLGVKKDIASFVLPLGATINMDGTALYQGVCALFIAQFFGIEFSLTQQAMVVLTATLASIGTAGVPGAGMVMLSMVLASVGLPLEGVAIIAGVDRILDMMRTMVNITGDIACSVFVAATEGELTKK
ncbi:MAG TPA: dicarboxylate/amino acid:cation symporter [Bacillota bacterium]|nr:dicarboxylate/amino acid:cation symporter [Bacillota bacterium]